MIRIFLTLILGCLGTSISCAEPSPENQVFQFSTSGVSNRLLCAS